MSIMPLNLYLLDSLRADSRVILSLSSTVFYAKKTGVNALDASDLPAGQTYWLV